MKFKAFTLLELLIASLITGVIGFIVVFFIDDMILVSKTQQTFDKQEEDLALFEMMLENDIFLSDTFYFFDNTFLIQKDTTEVIYSRNETEVYRISSMDSAIFYLPILDMNLQKLSTNPYLQITYQLADEKVKAMYIDESDYLR